MPIKSAPNLLLSIRLIFFSLQVRLVMKYHHGKGELTVRATDDVVVSSLTPDNIFGAHSRDIIVLEIKNKGT